ncbi:helix-turn-helix transcriptional regulator [Plantibacter cousiniae (nom. nud.)]|uniref:helix-turn-helix transcriptional regulator n=1 Tax=Plantibacter cousiniae (nom. nud.) TaxID=199709 RepID=UPI001D7BA651|nr:hypothetical protein [Plantibacter cousiniae]CAH0259047.1 hypothetical protein SRABI02_03367 [Plantibacter cousiniae]
MQTTHTNPLTALRRLPATVSLPTAGAFFGLSRAHSYSLNARGEFPVPVRQIGARFVVTQADLARALGIDVADLLDTEPA